MTPELEAALRELFAEPPAAIEVTLEQAAALLARLSRAQAVLLQRVADEGVSAGQERAEASPVAPAPTPTAWSADDLLTIDEAAAVLKVSPRWLYRHARALPFSRKLSRKTLRFSRVGLARWLATKRA